MDVLVTTAGGIEEDFMKCLGETYLGDFTLKGAELRSKGHNRIGNLVVPNDNYIKFESWIQPIFDQMLEEQNNEVSCSSMLPLLRQRKIKINAHERENKNTIVSYKQG